MSEFELQAAIMLLLVNKTERFRSSYFLIQIFSRKFGVLDIRPIAEHLIEKGYIECKVIKQVGHYTATSNGIAYLNQYEVLIRIEIARSYPSEVSFFYKCWNVLA